MSTATTPEYVSAHRLFQMAGLSPSRVVNLVAKQAIQVRLVPGETPRFRLSDALRIAAEQPHPNRGVPRGAKREGEGQP